MPHVFKYRVPVLYFIMILLVLKETLDDVR